MKKVLDFLTNPCYNNNNRKNILHILLNYYPVKWQGSETETYSEETEILTTTTLSNGYLKKQNALPRESVFHRKEVY